ncbi:MAG: type III-B CRISPR module-associated protein Cmr3 [Bacteroidia bacterium]
MRIRIKALDTLFFRDGKPFTMGQETWADGVFPPYPSVLHGAVRTWYISNQEDGLTDRSIKKSGEIQMNGIYYKLGKNIYLPMPLDFVEPKVKPEKEEIEEERKQEYRVIKLKLEKKHKTISKLSNYPLSAIAVPPDNQEVEEVESGFISGSEFLRYLAGTLNEVKIKKLNDIVIPEPKVGIGIDKNIGAVLENKLYRVGMRRTNDFEIILELDLSDNDFSHDANFIKLGAEGKISAFEDLEGKIDFLNVAGSKIVPNEGGFKIYMATPAIFEKGWRPDLEKFGIKAELIAAVVGKPVHIGGFDMIKKEPKPMLQAVPAGSVYYYKTQENSEKILETLNGKSISDPVNLVDPNHVQVPFNIQGFGICYIGNY